jgi:hypothetical protein
MRRRTDNLPRLADLVAALQPSSSPRGYGRLHDTEEVLAMSETAKVPGMKALSIRLPDRLHASSLR